MDLQERIDQWCRERDIWYVKLDVDVPSACLDEARLLYEQGYFVSHRDGTGHGWKSCALWGWVEPGGDLRDAWKTTTNPKGVGLRPDQVKWGLTGISELAPETTRWLSEFPGKHLRCRFMLLEPGGTIEAHTDRPVRTIWGAVNVAFNQPEGCHLHRTDTGESLPYEPSSAYYFDSGVMHEAHNGSDENRYHFIVSGKPDEASRHLMVKSLMKEYGRDVLNQVAVPVGKSC